MSAGRKALNSFNQFCLAFMYIIAITMASTRTRAATIFKKDQTAFIVVAEVNES